MTGFLQQLHRELALALGDAVWAFARIEWVVHDYLRRLSNDPLDELLADFNFRPRANVLRRLIQKREASQDLKKRALFAIEQAEGLADRRNIIVHNPWRIWIDLDAREFMHEIRKYSNPQKKVDLEQLRAFASECELAEQALEESLSAL